MPIYEYKCKECGKEFEELVPIGIDKNPNKKEDLMANETTDATFKDDVLNSEIPVLVDFWAPWCGPCRMVGPIIDRIGEKMKNKVKVFKLNVDENPSTAGSYGITGIPTVIIFKNGQIEREFVGVQPEQVYLDALVA